MSKQSNKDLEQQKLVIDLFELLGDDIGGKEEKCLKRLEKKLET